MSLEPGDLQNQKRATWLRRLKLTVLLSSLSLVSLFLIGIGLDWSVNRPDRERGEELITQTVKQWFGDHARGDGERYCSRLVPEDRAVEKLDFNGKSYDCEKFHGGDLFWIEEADRARVMQYRTDIAESLRVETIEIQEDKAQLRYSFASPFDQSKEPDLDIISINPDLQEGKVKPYFPGKGEKVEFELNMVNRNGQWLVDYPDGPGEHAHE
jgi:hypothetical protein